MHDVNCSPIPGMNPVLLSLGPFDLRWYALAYVVGLVLAWRYVLGLAARPRLWVAKGAPTPEAAPFKRDDVDELLFLAALGVIIGGRLGYVIFYQPDLIWPAPWRVLMTWKGGMSFHGGLLGVGLALWWLSRTRAIPLFRVADAAAVATPIGLFFGRIANFINGELYGRPSDVAWAMRFPCDADAAALGVEPFLRHPSQLYEASLEGLTLFAILFALTFGVRILARPGLATGVFLAGYGLSRTIVENFREPDAHMPDFPLGLTMGMMLSIPMILAGAALIWRAYANPAPAPEAAKKAAK